MRDGNRIDYDLCGEGNVSMLKKSLTAVIVGYVVQALALLLLAAAGGSVGALLGMQIFRHKTKHPKFTVGVPLILLVQIGLAVWWVLR